MRENFCYCETSKFHTSFDQIIQILILMFLCCKKTGRLLVHQIFFSFYPFISEYYYFNMFIRCFEYGIAEFSLGSKLRHYIIYYTVRYYKIFTILYPIIASITEIQKYLFAHITFRSFYHSEQVCWIQFGV